jgi:hypothetical protein
MLLEVVEVLAVLVVTQRLTLDVKVLQVLVVQV